MPFQITCKSLTLDDLEGQYCNRNCIPCSASSLATDGRDVTKFVDNMRIFGKFTAIRYSTNSWGSFWRIRIFYFIQLDWSLL